MSFYKKFFFYSLFLLPLPYFYNIFTLGIIPSPYNSYITWPTFKKSKRYLAHTTPCTYNRYSHTETPFIGGSRLFSVKLPLHKLNKTILPHEGWDLRQDWTPDYDYKDEFIRKRKKSLTPIYIKDVAPDTYARYCKLPEKDHIKVKKQLEFLKSWSFVDGLEININPNENPIPTFEKVKSRIHILLNKLDENTLYKCMVVGLGDKDVNSRSFRLKTAPSSWFISKQTDPTYLADQFLTSCKGIHMNYLSEDFYSWRVIYRKWLSRSEIKCRFEAMVSVVEDANRKKARFIQQIRQFNLGRPLFTDSGDLIDPNDWLSESCKKMCGFRSYDKITIGKYGKSMGKGFYKSGDWDISVRVVTPSKYEVVVYKEGRMESKWIDMKCGSSSNSWVRSFKALGIRVFYDKYQYHHAECHYNTESWTASEPEKEYDDKIGSLDIETYTDREGEGLSFPYAAGFRKLCGHEELFYIKAEEDPINLICRMIEKLCHPDNDGFTFYVHNLSRFDSRFILPALGRMGLKPQKLLGRAINEIFFIRLCKVVGDKKVRICLTDSRYILSSSLDSLSKKFGAETKGKFPYSFVRPNNLYYRGEIPPYSHYNKWSETEYQEAALKYSEEKPWCLKTETLKYLSQDLLCLINVMSSFNQSIYDKYKVNTTKVRSYSALSKVVYCSNYYKETKIKIPVIEGYLERLIRKGYYGGLVDVVDHLVTNAYKYDSNSHYPAAMLNDMPVGDPVITDEKDLHKLFGFCYAKVKAPFEEKLLHATLPHRDRFGVISCPRGRFEGVWFSEELKDNVSRGYEVDVISSIVFQRGKGLFDRFINDLFTSKAKAKEEGDKVGEIIYKLLMNSFYGKCGQLEIDNTYTMVETAKLHEYGKKRNFDLTQEFEQLTLVRDTGSIDPMILKLIKAEDEGEGSKPEVKGVDIPTKVPSKGHGGVKSSVGIAAAITAYGRISLNRFKNMSNNRYLGGDTDSAIMEKPLASKYVGKQLGMMKFENDITLGLYADKKLYYAIDSKGNENIKSRGIGVDFKGKNILKVAHFLLMLSGHTVKVNKTKFVLSEDGVDIQNVILKTKIQKRMYLEVVREIDGYLSTGNNAQHEIAKFITSLRKIKPRKTSKLLRCDSKALLRYLGVKWESI